MIEHGFRNALSLYNFEKFDIKLMKVTIFQYISILIYNLLIKSNQINKSSAKYLY